MAVRLAMATTASNLASSLPGNLKLSVNIRRRKAGASGLVSVGVPGVCRGKCVVVRASASGHVQPPLQTFSRGFFLLLDSVAKSFGEVSGKLGQGLSGLGPRTQEEMQLLAALKGRMVCAAAPIVLAAISQGPVNTPLTVVASGMAKWLELYSGVLMVRVLLSWFPNIPWERQPLQAMRDMCDPYLNLFRNIIPLFSMLLI